MRRITAYLLIVTIAVGLNGCGAKEKRGKRDKDEVVPVRVMTVIKQDMQKVLEYVGNVKGIDEAKVYPKVSGKIVEKVMGDGSVVAKGDVIAYIDRDEVGLTFEKAPIESPLAGVVGRTYVDIGSNVNIDTPIALVSNMEIAQINLDVPENLLPRVAVGQNAEVTIDSCPGEIFIAKVVKISPIVELETRAAPIELNIDNPDGKLQSGMFAKVKLILGVNEGVPAILKEAVMGKVPDTYVYVVQGDKALVRNVALGIRVGPLYEVTEGLSEGDRVVIMGQQKLKDGAIVAVEE